MCVKETTQRPKGQKEGVALNFEPEEQGQRETQTDEGLRQPRVLRIRLH